MDCAECYDARDAGRLAHPVKESVKAVGWGLLKAIFGFLPLIYLSVGALLGAARLMGMPPMAFVDLFIDETPAIFPPLSNVVAFDILFFAGAIAALCVICAPFAIRARCKCLRLGHEISMDGFKRRRLSRGG